MPFTCRYCKGIFCSLHRLPPNHDCIFVNEYKEQPLRDREFIEKIQGKSGSPQERVAFTLRNAILLRFSKMELVHLVIGTALVAAVGFSLYGYHFSWDFVVIFISAFIVHELAHKFLAQIYHTWAEFRLLLYGAAITAISALPFFPFKFIGPGAVFIGGTLSARRHGHVALIGPLTNLAMGVGFLVSYYASALLPAGTELQILLTGARFNGWIALFNLIPFMGLDGSKIFGWNKIVWILTMASAIGLFVAGDLISGGGIVNFFTRRF